MDTNFWETFEINSTEHKHVCIAAPRFDASWKEAIEQTRVWCSLYRKKSINKPHSLFKPQGSKLGKKVAAYCPEITVVQFSMTIWEYFFLLKNLRSVLTAYTVNRCFGFKWTIWKSTLLNCAKITIPLQYGQFDNFFLPKTVQKSLRDLFFFFFTEGKSLWLFLCSYFDICIVRESLSGFRWCSGIDMSFQE